MKRICGITAILAAVGSVVLMLGSSTSGSVCTRSMRGAVERENRVITDDGHEWVTDTSGIECGVRVVVTFNTRGTEKVTDDIIVNVQPIKLGTGFKSTYAQEGDF